MGRHFGDLAVIRGVIYYRLSPHELKPFAGAIKYGIPNFFPRTMATIATWLPPFAGGFALYTYIEHAYKLSKRKNPKDFIDEVNPNPPEPPPPPKSKCE